MDNIHEHLVSKRPTSADKAKRAALIAATVIVSLIAAALLMILFPMNLFLGGGIIYGGYFLVSGLDTEYEYIMTNNEIDIDKISGKRKRKRLITADITTFESFGRLADAPEAPDECTTVQVSDNTGEGEYFADMKHSSLGSVRIIFSPDEKMLEGIEHYLSSAVKSEYRRREMLSKK